MRDDLQRQAAHETGKVKTVKKRNNFSELTHLCFKKTKAFTSPVFSEEKEGGSTPYQRLEFLGDAVLEYIVSSRIFHHYPLCNEGDLSRVKSVYIRNKVR